MDIEFGNAGAIETNDTGWFVGFSDWTKAGPNLRYMPADRDARTICVKWYHHPKGHPYGEVKPISEGRTISLLVSERGRFNLEFSLRPDFAPSASESFVLMEHGDFVIWGPGIYHRAVAEEPSTILTVRWNSER